ncbi:glucose-6-phosphate dehydrogenase [Agaribacterium haliotis]|uniref:glucose-6-phosphate dehydrogenase n=1 Tax=Agaribacterium haliotis TaxID=2013869 RepID=UPI000BB55904|nr:glucose-6-phosphate dehydrogenase [Agaribacterium haliotis]
MSTDLLIVGGDGDLALRKLYPSLYYLEINDCMPEGMRIIGSARTGQSREEFHAKIKLWLQKAVDASLFSEEKWLSFADKIYFAQGDATQPEQLKLIGEEFFRQDAVQVIYLSIPPQIFGKVCESLDACGLVKDSTRLVVEKPLGDSRESFLAINAELARVFDERQLFRIDHYLGKESVQNLLALRFANDFFEPLWNNKYIESVQITVTETVGVGNRWAFYDKTGATRDMVQNHLLQVLCLMAMEPPSALDADSVRTEKLKVLKSLKPITKDEVFDHTVRGQYIRGDVGGETVPGYLEEESDKYEVDPNSQTETYVAIESEIENWRWSGVPIYLRTGKRLNKKHSEIVVYFKQSHHNIFKDSENSRCQNKLIIQLQPDSGISLHLNNKVQGLDAGIPLRDDILNLDFEDHSEPMKHDAYSRLFFDVFRNDQTLFVSADEVETAWKWIDQIFDAWQERGQKCEPYEAGTEGPERANMMVNSRGQKWYDGEYCPIDLG